MAFLIWIRFLVTSFRLFRFQQFEFSTSYQLSHRKHFNVSHLPFENNNNIENTERKIAIKSRSWVVDVVGDSYVNIRVIFGRWIHDLVNLFTIYPDFIKMSFIIDISIMNFEIFFKRSELHVFLSDLVHMIYCFDSYYSMSRAV